MQVLHNGMPRLGLSFCGDRIGGRIDHRPHCEPGPGRTWGENRMVLLIDLTLADARWGLAPTQGLAGVGARWLFGTPEHPPVARLHTNRYPCIPTHLGCVRRRLAGFTPPWGIGMSSSGPLAPFSSTLLCFTRRCGFVDPWCRAVMLASALPPDGVARDRLGQPASCVACEARAGSRPRAIGRGQRPLAGCRRPVADDIKGCKGETRPRGTLGGGWLGCGCVVCASGCVPTSVPPPP